MFPTKSAPKAQDMANKTNGNRRTIARYDIAAAYLTVEGISKAAATPVVVKQFYTSDFAILATQMGHPVSAMLSSCRGS